METYPQYAFPKLSLLPPGRKRRRVTIVASPNPDPLESIGPLNAFRMANFVFENSGHGDYGYDLEVVASTPGAVFEENGLTISVNKPYYRLRGKPDTLLVTPMTWEELFSASDDYLAWLRKQSQKVARIGSICSAAYILAQAGILDHRRATTHWDLIADFRRRYPRVVVEEEPVYVNDGDIYSSAGMTAGIDMTLALIEDDFGNEVALRAAQALVVFLKRPGNQAQFSVQLPRHPDNPVIARLQSYIYANIDKDLRIEKLAEHVHMSPRNLSRTFVREVGMPPGQFVEHCRLETARSLLMKTHLSIGKVAARCGYRSIDSMRLAFKRTLEISPRAYRKHFTSARTNR